MINLIIFEKDHQCSVAANSLLKASACTCLYVFWACNPARRCCHSDNRHDLLQNDKMTRPLDITNGSQKEHDYVIWLYTVTGGITGSQITKLTYMTAYLSGCHSPTCKPPTGPAHNFMAHGQANCMCNCYNSMLTETLDGLRATGIAHQLTIQRREEAIWRDDDGSCR